MTEYWIEGLIEQGYTIKGPFENPEDTETLKSTFDKHWVTSKVTDGKITYLEWSK